MLRREMICHAGVIDDRQSNQALLARPWQRRVCRQKQRKASCCYENRQRDEPDGLLPQERPIRFRAVSEIGARQSVTNPKKGGQTEVQQIEWARLRVRITVSEPQHDRREPERAQHPETVPERSAHPC